MNDREMWWKISLIAGLITIGSMSVIPLDRNIKLGIDLRGGYSLLYEIDDSGMDATQKTGLSDRVMAILKERVDPNGVLNLVWRPVGNNRLEIQMPRPPQSVSETRAKYVIEQEKLIQTVMRRGDVTLALARKGPEREGSLAALVQGVPARTALLAKLAEKYDAMKALESSDDDAKLEAAEKEYDAAFNAVMATNLELGRLDSALAIDLRKMDRESGRPLRDVEIERLKKDVPDMATQIASAVEAYNAWQVLRGREGSLDDPADLQRLLRGAGVLEFRVLAEVDPADPNGLEEYSRNLQKRGPRRAPGDRYGWFQIENPGYFFKSKNVEQEFDAVKRRFWWAERYADKYYVLAHLDESKCLAQDRDAQKSWELKSALPTRDEEGRPAVAFTLDERGGNRFYKLTSENKNKQLCFFLDGMAVSAANIASAIRTQGRITGSFSQEEVQQLCQKLNAGSLPRKLKEPPISVHGIGPSLGLENRTAGMRAAFYSSIAVAVFMIGYYFYSGGLAVAAVMLNVLLTGAVVAMLNATMTLPGIAGLVLSVGMAVDANVLINERIREELHRGQTMRSAIKLGYERAFAAIFDSGLTTMLTCAILYWIGTEEIRGFGLTLGWGVAINLLTAVFITHVFFDYMDMTRIPVEIHRNPGLLAGAATVVGGVLWGLGYSLHSTEQLRQESILIFFGKTLVAFLPATLGTLGFMAVMRGIHRAWQKVKPNDLPMLYLIRVPKFNWYGIRRVCYAISIVTTLIGMAVFARRDDKDLYDIEFIGGTAAQIDLKKPGAIGERDVHDRLAAAADEMRQLADRIARASVTAEGQEFLLAAEGVPADRLANAVRAHLTNYLPQGGVRADPDRPGRVQVQFKSDAKFADGASPSVASISRELTGAAALMRNAAAHIADAQVQEITDASGAHGTIGAFEIVTRETNRELVVDAILAKLKDDLDILPSLTFVLKKDDARGGVPYFPVVDGDLGKVIGDSAVSASAADALGGVAIVLENISPPQTAATLQKRLHDMRLQPGQAGIGWRQQKVIGLTPAGSEGGQSSFSRAAILISDENYAFEEGSDTTAAWRSELAEPEVKLVRQSLERQTSLGKVTQFAPQVAAESKGRAYVALILSWLMIVIYVWFRFGSVAWGFAAVVALIHDAVVALGFVAGAYLIADSPVGRLFLVEPFRIDLAIIAALLTVVGYSVNDTIVVFDRIRENRGKLKGVTPQLVNDSINQTMSRTILTVLTVLITLVIMYVFGGRAIHGFNYAMLIGVLTGCYSSIAVASPILVGLEKRTGEAAAT